MRPAALPPAPAGPRALGAGLRRWRRLNMVKQEALAADLGVSQATLSRWEAGRARPEGRMAARVLRLIEARPTSAADRALLALVNGAPEPVHLVCDVTHRLLAASPARQASWQRVNRDLTGETLWPFASEGIVTGEARLEAAGWYAPLPEEVVVTSGHHSHGGLVIEAGDILWTRLPLSDGSHARLVRDGARAGARNGPQAGRA